MWTVLKFTSALESQIPPYLMESLAQHSDTVTKPDRHYYKSVGPVGHHWHPSCDWQSTMVCLNFHPLDPFRTDAITPSQPTRTLLRVLGMIVYQLYSGWKCCGFTVDYSSWQVDEILKISSTRHQNFLHKNVLVVCAVSVVDFYWGLHPFQCSRGEIHCKYAPLILLQIRHRKKSSLTIVRAGSFSYNI